MTAEHFSLRTASSGSRFPSRALIISLFAALSFWIVIANFGTSRVLIGGDASAVWADPTSYLLDLAGIYHNYTGLGYNGALWLGALFPLLTTASALQAFGLSPPAIERIVFAAMFFLTFLGEYTLVRAVLQDRVTEEQAEIGSFFAALVYGVNAYVVWAYSGPIFDLMLSYAALPWVAYGVCIGAQRRALTGIGIVAIAIIIDGGSATNVARFGVLLLVIPIAAMWFIVEGRAQGRIIKTAIFGTILGLLGCAWWLLTLPTIISTGLRTVTNFSVTAWLEWMSQRSSFARLFKFDGTTGGLDIPHASWYTSLNADIFGYLPLLIAVLCFGRLRPRLGAMLLVTFLVTDFLAKGTHAPLGFIYAALIDHVPGFTIFRSPWDKWMPLGILAISTLFGMSLASLASWLANGLRLRWLSAIACVVIGILATCVYPWPAFAGSMLRNPSEAGGAAFLTNVPVSYSDVARILRRAPPTERTVIFNSGAPPYPLFTWGYVGQDPLLGFARNPITDFTDVANGLQDAPETRLERALRWLNVRYVVVHRDVKNGVTPPLALGALVHDHARPVYSSAQLDLYELIAQPGSIVHSLQNPIAMSTDALQRSLHTIVGSLDLSPNVNFRLDDFPNRMLLSPVDQSNVLPPLTAVAEPIGSTQLRGELDLLVSNPQTRYVRFDKCGRAHAIAVAYPTEWYAGAVDLTPHVQRICTGKSPLRISLVANSQTVIPNLTQFDTLVNDALRVSDGSRDTSYGLLKPKAGLIGASVTYGSIQLRPVRTLSPKMKDVRALVRAQLGAGYPVLDATNIGYPVQINNWSDPTDPLAARYTSGRGQVNFTGTVNWTTTALLSVGTAYRLSLNYRTKVTGALSVRLDGGQAVLETMSSDGAWHRSIFDVFPDATSSGIMSFKVSTYAAGDVSLRDVRLEELGPNGVLFTRSSNAAPEVSSADIASFTHPLPWIFRVDLRNCRRCALGINVNDVKRWIMLPGHIVARFEGPGAATGPTEAILRGSSAFVIDTASERSTVWFVYAPAILFLIGAVIAVAALAFSIVLVRTSRGAKPEQPSSEQVVPPFLLVCSAMAMLVASAVYCDAKPESDSMIASLWAYGLLWLLVVQGLFCPAETPKFPGR
ncbi:MAG: hypothetical protein ABSE64_07465 [Vulcanimicrobiaceae bacterium]